MAETNVFHFKKSLIFIKNTYRSNILCVQCNWLEQESFIVKETKSICDETFCYIPIFL